MYGKMKLFARKKAENNDGFFFFSSLFHSSSILDMLFLVRFWFSGRGISCALIVVCEKVKNGHNFRPSKVMKYIYISFGIYVIPWPGVYQKCWFRNDRILSPESWLSLIKQIFNALLVVLIAQTQWPNNFDHYKSLHIMWSKFGRRTYIFMSFRGSVRGPCLQKNYQSCMREVHILWTILVLMITAILDF